MNGNIKRLLICLPNQPNLCGIFTLEDAKSLANEKCPDQSKVVSIMELDNNDVISCLERNDGDWIEKEVRRLVFNNH